MKHSHHIQWFAGSLLLLGLWAGSTFAQDLEFPAPPEDPEYVKQIHGMDTSACQRKKENAQRIKDAYYGLERSRIPDEERAASTCNDAIRESYEKCTKTPDTSKLVAGDGNGLKNAPATLKANSEAGQQMNDSKAQECKDERDKAQKNCDERRSNLKTALDEHRRAQLKISTEYQNNPTNSELKQRLDDGLKTTHQLESQIRNTEYLSKAGRQALDDYQNCYALEARRNEIVANNSDAIVAAASDKDPTTVVPKLDQTPASEVPTNIDKACGAGTDQLCSSSAGYVSDTAQKQLKAAALQGVGEQIGGTSGELAGAAGRMMLTSNAPMWSGASGAAAGWAMGAGLGGVGVLLSSTSPTAPCDQNYTTNLSANAAGCSIATQSAINALNAP